MNFYLLPTYDDVYYRSLKEFPKFDRLIAVVNKLKEKFYEEAKFGNLRFYVLHDSDNNDLLQMWAPKKKKNSSDLHGDEKWRKVTKNLIPDVLTVKQKEILDFLVDAFNRFPLRAISFISTVINIDKHNDFRKWTKEDLDSIHKRPKIGFSHKVAGCFIQQGFGNVEIAPIDIWIDSFCKNVFDIKGENFLMSFSNVGKLERMLWFAGQARK